MLSRKITVGSMPLYLNDRKNASTFMVYCALAIVNRYCGQSHGDTSIFERMRKRTTNEQKNDERTNERTKERTNGQTNERMNGKEWKLRSHFYLAYNIESWVNCDITSLILHLDIKLQLTTIFYSDLRCCWCCDQFVWRT